MFSKKLIRLSKSCISNAEKRAVRRVLNNEFLGMGQEVKEFEEELSKFFGRPSTCVVNGTASLHLAIQGCGIKKGDEVLVQSLTYVASIQAISAANALPIFCEINPNDCSIDIKDAEKKLTNKTKAIMPVHYAGGAGCLKDIYHFAKRNNLRVIEDCAHAFGSYYENKLIGSFGDISCFSFDGIKNITSGEGGCIVSNDEKFIQRIRDSRLLGVIKDSESRYKDKRSWDFDVKEQGWRYHMSNIMAAIGKEQLKRFDSFKRKRQLLAKEYLLRLKEIDGIQLLDLDYKNIVMHIFPILIEKNREDIRELLLKKGIQTGIHYLPNHYLSFYKNKFSSNLPITETIYPKLLTLPLHPDLSLIDIKFISKQLIKLIKQ